jgi:hypothetical protein
MDESWTGTCPICGCDARGVCESPWGTGTRYYAYCVADRVYWYWGFDPDGSEWGSNGEPNYGNPVHRFPECYREVEPKQAH